MFFPAEQAAICKDMDFPELARDHAQAGVEVMLVPAWDFVRDAWFHQRMAVMRGVEGGYAVIRTAQDGLATVSDDRGRVLAAEHSWSSPEVLLTAEVTPGPGGTLYSGTGDWFGWQNVLLLVLTVSAPRRK